MFACNANDNNNSNCNFLFDAGVNLTVDTTFPQFSQLAFITNKVYVPNQGNNGIWLYRASTSSLLAWDAADPSHPPVACSTLEDSGNADIVICGCEDANQYSLILGLPVGENTQPCTLQPYRVEVIGTNSFLISN